MTSAGRTAESTLSNAGAVAPTFGRDVARFGTAIGVAVALGAVQVFVLPRRLDLATYGQYRFFLVYYGYLGVLHFGLADGAFVRWAGRPRGVVRFEWPRVLGWLLVVQALIVAAALVAGVFAGPLPRLYLTAFALCALGANVAMLMSYALQAAGAFRSAGLIAVLPPAVFVTEILVFAPHTLTGVLVMQVASVAVAAVSGIVAVALIRDASEPPPDPVTAAGLVRVGLPVLGANLAAGASQFADRILVSVAVPVTSLALYGFASTVAVAASAATQALSRVALSHAARRTGADRAAVLDGVYDLVAAGFGVALAGLPLFEFAVQRMLPAYVDALPIVRALALGTPFWIALHVVLVGTLQSYGMVRRQFAIELAGTAVVLSACGACLVLQAPLWSVAGAGSAAAVVMWSTGVALVRRWVPDAASQHATRFAARIAWQGGAALAVTALPPQWIVRTVAYALLALIPTLFAARATRANWRQ